MLIGALFPTVGATRADEPLVFISAFAAGKDGAIHAFQLDRRTGYLKPVHRTANVENPFFLAVSPNQKFLYSIHARKFGGKEHEQVAAYAIAGRTGQLKLLNRQSALGSAACYLDVDATGKTVLVANYSTGSVVSLPVREDGSLGEAVSFIQHSGLQRRSGAERFRTRTASWSVRRTVLPTRRILGSTRCESGISTSIGTPNPAVRMPLADLASLVSVVGSRLHDRLHEIVRRSNAYTPIVSWLHRPPPRSQRR